MCAALPLRLCRFFSVVCSVLQTGYEEENNYLLLSNSEDMHCFIVLYSA